MKTRQWHLQAESNQISLWGTKAYSSKKKPKHIFCGKKKPFWLHCQNKSSRGKSDLTTQAKEAGWKESGEEETNNWFCFLERETLPRSR